MSILCMICMIVTNRSKAPLMNLLCHIWNGSSREWKWRGDSAATRSRAGASLSYIS